MKITKNNLDDVMFENQDARLLIEDVVSHTGANLYYYHDVEITVKYALDIWYKAQAAEACDDVCSISFMDFIKGRLPQLLCS